MFGRKELQIPAAAKGDRHAAEVLRVWDANDAQHVVLDPAAWDDPACWGLLLVDIARHAARALHQSRGLDEAEAFDRILWGLQAELDNPTDEPTGGIDAH